MHNRIRQDHESALLDRLRAKLTLPLPPERRLIREAAGASLRDVASELGTSATSVIRWERGANPGKHADAYARLLAEFQLIAIGSPETRAPALAGTRGAREDRHGKV
jgi:transcriptional regulator with XRE-family HTH domain